MITSLSTKSSAIVQGIFGLWMVILTIFISSSFLISQCLFLRKIKSLQNESLNVNKKHNRFRTVIFPIFNIHIIRHLDTTSRCDISSWHQWITYLHRIRLLLLSLLTSSSASLWSSLSYSTWWGPVEVTRSWLPSTSSRSLSGHSASTFCCSCSLLLIERSWADWSHHGIQDQFRWMDPNSSYPSLVMIAWKLIFLRWSHSYDLCTCNK